MSKKDLEKELEEMKEKCKNFKREMSQVKKENKSLKSKLSTANKKKEKYRKESKKKDPAQVSLESHLDLAMKIYEEGVIKR